MNAVTIMLSDTGNKINYPREINADINRLYKFGEVYRTEWG